MKVFTLADNGVSGCSAVVGAEAWKWGYFGGGLVQPNTPDRLVGPVLKIPIDLWFLWSVKPIMNI